MLKIVNLKVILIVKNKIKMNFTKKLLNIFMLIGLSLFISNAVFAAGSLNLELVGQTPDPVNPGSFVYVSVKISNLGSDSVSNARLSFDETLNFKVAEGQDGSVTLGVISEQNSVIKRFKILVGNNAPLGLNSLKFIVTSSIVVEDTVDILVGGSNVGLVTKSFSIDSVAPGSSSKLIIEFENLNNNNLKDVIVSLNLDSVEDKVFSLASGSNERVITRINSRATSSVEFDLIASPDASSKPYLIPITIKYTDDLGVLYTKNIIGSVRIFSEPVLSLSLDSQESFSKGKSKFTFAIANPGTSSIKGTMVEVVGTENYNVLSGLVQYVGDLNPDDFQTIQSDIFVKSESLSSVKLKVTYLDSYNNKVEKFFDIPVSFYSETELAELGLEGANGSGSAGVATYGIFLVLLIGTFYFGKTRGAKHK